MGQHEPVVLGKRGQRQEHVRQSHGRGVHEGVRAHHEVQFLERRRPALRLRRNGTVHDVRAVEVPHVYLVGLAGLQHVQHHVGLVVVVDVADARVFLGADALFPQLGRHEVDALAVAVLLRIRCGDPRQHAPARNVQIVGDAQKGNEGHGRLRAVHVLVEREAPCQGGMLSRRELARGLADAFRRHPGDLLGLLGRHLRHARGELVEAVDPPVNEVVVVQVLLNHDVHHGHGQGGVRAGAQLQDHVGPRAKPRHARIDADDLRSQLHEVHDGMAQRPSGFDFSGSLPHTRMYFGGSQPGWS